MVTCIPSLQGGQRDIACDYKILVVYEQWEAKVVAIVFVPRPFEWDIGQRRREDYLKHGSTMLEGCVSNDPQR